MADTDRAYLEVLIRAIRVCAKYRPMMGRKDETGVDLEGFQRLYEGDPFYHWFGLDNPLMYAAHKAAGGMTSIYRQIGIGVEHLFRRLLQDQLGLTADQAAWNYTLRAPGGRTRRMSLDGRIDLEHVADPLQRQQIKQWLDGACELLGVEPAIARQLRGAVFEVRQGYKSKDSKRQNADIGAAATALAKAYLPCLVVLSTQIDEDIAYRYASVKWLVLKGTASGGSPLESTYTFFKSVVGYDLQGFFERNSAALRREIDDVLRRLLSTE